MHTYTAPQLYAYMRDILAAAGATEPVAAEVADVLVGANLAGHDSHGLLRIPMYSKSIADGRILPAETPTIEQDTGNTVVMDGRRGHGIYTCKKGVELAIERAKEVGTCVVTFRRIEHIGRLGHYVEMAAREGCVSFVTVGSGQAGNGAVLPFGSKAPTFGTNPIAWGVPTGDDAPFVLDYATSVVAEGKLRVARSKGLELAEGTIVDKDGKPTNDPWAFYDGGALLPFAGHKGSALTMLPCLLGSLGGSYDAEKKRAHGCFIMVLDVSRFTDRDTYQASVREFLDTLKATEPADGVQEVLVPGDFEARNRAHRLEHGVDVPPLILEELQEWNEKWGVDLDTVVPRPEDITRFTVKDT